MNATEQKQPVLVSREELYALVWTSPMSHLAARYGITGTGLAKICARLDIPCPPRGYWAKKAAGKPVVQYRLPEAKADTPLEVTIPPRRRRLPPRLHKPSARNRSRRRAKPMPRSSFPTD